MNFRTINIMAIFFILLGVFCVNAADTIEDNIITVKVKTRLMEEQDLPAKDIKIVMENGVVKLEGKLETCFTSKSCYRIASSIDNVINVDAR
ncbi:MAG: BON domain-containing protein [Candidatus Rickettsia vulgarisii]